MIIPEKEEMSMGLSLRAELAALERRQVDIWAEMTHRKSTKSKYLRKRKSRKSKSR